MKSWIVRHQFPSIFAALFFFKFLSSIPLIIFYWSDSFSRDIFLSSLLHNSYLRNLLQKEGDFKVHFKWTLKPARFFFQPIIFKLIQNWFNSFQFVSTIWTLNGYEIRNRSTIVLSLLQMENKSPLNNFIITPFTWIVLINWT